MKDTLEQRIRKNKLVARACVAFYRKRSPARDAMIGVGEVRQENGKEYVLLDEDTMHGAQGRGFSIKSLLFRLPPPQRPATKAPAKAPAFRRGGLENSRRLQRQPRDESYRLSDGRQILVQITVERTVRRMLRHPAALTSRTLAALKTAQAAPCRRRVKAQGPQPAAAAPRCPRAGAGWPSPALGDQGREGVRKPRAPPPV